MEQILNIINQYLPYLNLLFYVLILLPIVIGLFVGLSRGFKKALWKFIIRIIVLLVFILTLNLIVNQLFNATLFGLPGVLENAILGTSSTATKTLKDLADRVSEVYLSNLNGQNLDLEYVRALVYGVVKYALKIVWMVLYFIIIVPIFRIFTGIIYKTMVKGKKEFIKVNKEPALGMLVGILNGFIGAFIFMMMFNGLMSLISYTGEIATVSSGETAEEGEATTDGTTGDTTTDDTTTTDSTTSEVSFMIDGKSYIIKLADGEEGSGSGGSSIDTTQIAEVLKMVQAYTPYIKEITKVWDSNFFVKAADGIYINVENGTDADGNTIYKKESTLDKAFDELIYIEYSVKGEETEDTTDTEKKDLYIKINYLTEINKILNAALYVLDDSDLIVDGAIDLSKLSSARVKAAFNSLSDVQLLRVAMSVGLNYAFVNLNNQIEGIDLSDTNFQNDLYNTDFTTDISSLGDLVASLVDIGLGSALQDYISGKNTDVMSLVTTMLTPAKKDAETDADYTIRVKTLRDAVSANLSNFNLIKKADDIVVSYLVNSMFKTYVDEYNLNDDDINHMTGVDAKTYVETLIDEIDLSSDLATILNVVYAAVDFNGTDNNLTFLKDNMNDLTTAIDTRGDYLTIDYIADFFDTVLTRVSEISFLQATFDIGVKILTVTMSKNEEASYAKYLTESNIFSGYINWKNEIGEDANSGVRGLVGALVDADILGLVKGADGIMDTLWNKEGGLEAYLHDTITALFSLTIVSNLEDTCLKDLLSSYLSGLSDTITIKISDKLGTEGHGFKDELLNMLSLVDDLIEGAKGAGATSFDSMFNADDIKVLVKAIANIDAEKLEASDILGPTIVNYLSTMENDTLVVPYIYEDSHWFTTYNTDGSVKERGELYNIVSAIKDIASNDTLIDAITSSSDTDSILNAVKSISEETIDALFSSATIQATITNLLSSIGGGSSDSFSIVVPSTSKEAVTISKYKTTDDVVVGEEYIEVVEGETTTKVYLAQAKYLKKAELTSIIKALWQIPNLNDLLDSTKMVGEILKLNDNAIDNEGNETIFEEDNVTKKSRTEVMFESDILRCTISNFLTGSDYQDTYFIYPVTDMEEIDGKYYIKKTSVNELFDSLFVLLGETNITSIDNISTSIVDDIVSLSDEKLDSLFKSNILKGTISNLIEKQDSISIPTSATTNTLCIGVDSENTIVTNKEKYIITSDELKALMHTLHKVFPDGVDLENSFNVTSLMNNMLELGYLYNKGITANLTDFFESKIFVTTLSKYVFDVDSLYVPSTSAEIVDVISYDSTSSVFSTKGSVSLTKAECISLIASMDYLFPYKKGGLSGDLSSIDYNDCISNIVSLSSGELTGLFTSGILRATISNQVISTSAIIIPEDISTTEKVVSKTSSGYSLTDKEMHFISASSDVDLLKSLSMLFPDSVDLTSIDTSIISDLLKLSTSELNTLFESDVIRATITKQLVDSANISIPMMVGSTTVSSKVDTIFYDGTTYTTGQTVSSSKDELVKLMKALFVLFGDNVDINNISIDNFKSLSSKSSAELDTLTASYILDATISDKLSSAFGSSSSQSIVIPYTVTVSYTKYGKEDAVYMVNSTELKSLIKAMGYIDFDTIGGSNPIDAVKLLNGESNEAGKKQIEIVLESAIMQATISDVVLSMSTGSMTTIIPSTALDKLTFKATIGSDTGTYALSLATMTPDTTKEGKIISETEIVKLIDSLNYIDLDAFSTGDSTFDVLKGFTSYISLTGSERKVDVILSSDIIRATLSNYIITMDVSSIKIYVPKSDSVLEIADASATDKYLFTNESNAASAQANIYIIKSSELKAFIVAASALDIDKLSSDPINSILDLNKVSSYDNVSTNMGLIISSAILKVSVSNYLFDNTSSLGFSAIVFPNDSASGYDVISETETVKYESGSFSSVTKSYIEGYRSSEADGLKYELERLVSGMQYLDMKNMTGKTIKTLSSLSEVVSGTTTKLDMILKSEILYFSVSSQLESTSIDDSTTPSTWSFILPEQSYVLSSGTRVTYQYYGSVNSMNLITKAELASLISVLGSVDIEHLSSELVLTLTESDLEELLTSKILIATVSSKFKDSISNNTNLSTYYDATILETATVTYREHPSDPTSVVDAIEKAELLHIFGSMNVLGDSKLGSVNIDMSSMNNLTDDGDTSNDDDETYDSQDSRAKFLRSKFFRNLFCKKVLEGTAGWSYTSMQDTSVVTSHIDTTWYAGGTLAGPSDTTLSLSNAGLLTWNATPSANYYMVSVNGQTLSSTYSTNSADISTYLASISSYSINVTAYKATYPLTKPATYTMLNWENSGTLSQVASSSITDDVLTFPSVTNAGTYTIKFYNNGTLVLTEKINDESGDDLSISLANLLAPGSYSYKIVAESRHSYYLTSPTTYESTTNYVVTGTFGQSKIELKDGKIYFTEVTNATNYELKIGTYTATSFTSFTTTGGASGYYFDLSGVSLTDIPYGKYDVELTIKAPSYTDKVQSFTYRYLESVAKSSITTDQSNISFTGVTNAEKYIIRVYNSSNQLVMYKEITTTSLGIDTLEKGQAYKVSITPISTTNSYLSSSVTSDDLVITKSLNKPIRLSVSEELLLMFESVSNASSYRINIYDLSVGETTTIATKDITSALYETEVIDGVTYIKYSIGDLYEYTESGKYSVKVVAIGTSPYISSAESSSKKFNLTPIDRPYDLALSSGKLTFSDIDGNNGYKLVITDVTDSSNITSFYSGTLTSGTGYTVESGLVTIDLTSETFGTYTEGHTYRIVVYTETTSNGYTESYASVGVKLFK